MLNAPKNIQKNFLNALSGGNFDFIEASVKFYIGNSVVHFFNGVYGRTIYIESRAQMDESVKWVVKMDDYNLGKDGEYYYEPMPSSRTDAFIKMTRFDSKEEALEVLLKYERDNKGQNIPLYIKEVEED